jgi:hypothetical protein
MSSFRRPEQGDPYVDPTWLDKPPQPRRGTPRIVVGLVGLAVGLSAGLGIAALLGLGLGPGLRPDPVTVGPGGDLAQFSPVAGQCASGRLDEGTSFGPASIVPCTGPHDLEVYAALPGAELRDERYPDPDILAIYADSGCYTAFESFVDRGYGDSHFDYVPVIPTKGAWAAGDHDVRCVLVDPDDEPQVGSGRGSRR